MYSVNRRKLLLSALSAPLASCGGGGDSDADGQAQRTYTPGFDEAYAQRGQPVFGFNLSDHVGNVVADSQIMGMHYNGTCPYVSSSDGLHTFQVLSDRGPPLVVFDVIPDSGHWYRMEHLQSFGGGLYRANVRSSEGANTRLVSFAPGAPRTTNSGYGIEVYGPSGPQNSYTNTGVVFASAAGPLLVDQIVDFAGAATQNTNSAAPQWEPGSLIDQTAYSLPSSRIGVVGQGLPYVAVSSLTFPRSFNQSAYRLQSGQVQRVVGHVFPISNVVQQTATIVRPAESVLLIDLTRYL